ncbi:MmcQ/YjbR family DNA-binding protein [Cellulomonas chitinilytica]|uniref:MmcQ/YjbR family DNA-binding protein n=1 Tax=Cellulomonas chitinilytica TaxID=398759 RepID=UPI001940FAC8|nr:MmcQ/YjbR family DNA-binding protein [Cellulomonas chitinilytica]
MSQERVLGWGDDDVAEARRRIGAVVGRLPETTAEVDPYGNTGFFTRGKRFAWILPDHHADGRLALWCKADRHEQQAIVARDPDRYFVAPYMGRYGWVAAHLDAAHSPDWTELEEIVEAGWRLSATRAAVAAFDAAAEPGTTTRRPPVG